MKVLSKSKLIAFRQCPKRLWLEVHQPELREDSSTTQSNFATGHAIGAIARALYDPERRGVELDVGTLGMAGLLARTRELLAGDQPIFEAGFVTGHAGRDALALADVLLPDVAHGERAWRMVEVKSSTSVKPTHRDDAAIQYHVAVTAGVKLSGISLARIDNTWVYPGGGDYRGLLVEESLTEDVAGRQQEVAGWIAQAHDVVEGKEPPAKELGGHCADPYECGFLGHCTSEHEAVHGVVEHPVYWLPRIQRKALKEFIETGNTRSLADVPDDLLNDTQLRVKQHTLAGTVYFDWPGAAAALAPYKLPALFLDFETVGQAIPLWAGTRPYQAIPFQFSLHRLGRTGKIDHCGFLSLSGNDPGPQFARALIEACGERLPIFVYNRGFESVRIKEMALRYPHLSHSLLAINERLVDLLPVAQAFYYNPSQQGSWSIKAVLPAMAPDLSYDALDGVQDGGMAQLAFVEAIDSATTADRKEEIRQQLWGYCRLDTFAMVRVWAFLTGRTSFVDAADTAPSLDLTR